MISTLLSTIDSNQAPKPHPTGNQNCEALTQRHDDSEVLVRVEGVGKKFCRNLKKSLWYGMKDVMSEMNPVKRRVELGNELPLLRPDEFWANQDISFELRRGECLGLIGRNGAGKTTLLKMLNGLIKPDTGRIEMHGRVGALIALGAGFNPILTGRENIYVNGSVLGLSKQTINEKIDEIIDFAEIREFIDTPVQSYSSGMAVRLGFSAAVNLLRPDVLILDEVLAVGDAAFRAKCEKKISEILSNAAVIFVSHQALHIRRLCDKVLWLDRGKNRAMGNISEILPEYEKASRNAGATATSSITKIDEIASVSPQNIAKRLGYGDELSLSIKFVSTRPVLIGAVVVGFAQGEVLVAQTNMESTALIIGEQTLHIQTGPLFLKNGIYVLNLALYGDSYKKLVVRYLSFGEIEIATGPDGYCHYQIPASFKLI